MIVVANRLPVTCSKVRGVGGGKGGGGLRGRGGCGGVEEGRLLRERMGRGRRCGSGNGAMAGDEKGGGGAAQGRH